MLLLFKFIGRSRIALYLLGALVSALLVSVVTIGSSALFFASSLINVQHAPFDGTVYPYAHVPNWAEMSDSQRDLSYDQVPDSLLMDPIEYDPSMLTVPFDSLDFDGEDADIRNAKITYSVPYLGNYKLDGHEHVGSHAAVDIKLPKRTPILTIANGVVMKAENDPGGFGQHVVIRHSNVPSLDDPNKTVDYYSGYAHMLSFSVDPGEVVSKGQQIGLSGGSGNTTTNHLHFQIDKSNAPWHPYWPFSGTDARNAGLSFFEAINEGLGLDNAQNRTIHPMDYVEKFMNYSGIVQPDDVKVEEVDEDEEDPLVVDVETVEDTKVVDIDEAELSVTGPDVMIFGQEYKLTVNYESRNGTLLAGVGNDDFEVNPSLAASLTLPQSASFAEGEVNVPIIPRELGVMNVQVEIGDEKTYLRDVEVRLFKDMASDDPDINELKFLREVGVIKGYPDFSFKPERSVARAEALKFLVEVLPGDVELSEANISFSDVRDGSWYYKYLQNSVALGAVDSDETFEPSREVNMAEFLKMLFIALKVDVDPVVDPSYSEYFKITRWYSPYLQEAIKRGIIDAEDSRNFYHSLSRRDIARIAYKFISVVEED